MLNPKQQLHKSSFQTSLQSSKLPIQLFLDVLFCGLTQILFIVIEPQEQCQPTMCTHIKWESPLFGMVPPESDSRCLLGLLTWSTIVLVKSGDHKMNTLEVRHQCKYLIMTYASECTVAHSLIANQRHNNGQPTQQYSTTEPTLTSCSRHPTPRLVG